MENTSNLSKVQQVLFNSAKRFYLQIGKTETQAIKLAFKDIEAKFNIADDKWIDITTGKQVHGNF
jgi:hypothetical protein